MSDTITTVEQLDALPVGSVVLTDRPHKDTPFDEDDAYRLAFQRVYDGSWRRSGRSRDTDPQYILPATVLYRPDAALAPLIEAAVREQIVSELEAHNARVARLLPRFCDQSDDGYLRLCGQRSALDFAIRIARGATR